MILVQDKEIKPEQIILDRNYGSTEEIDANQKGAVDELTVAVFDRDTTLNAAVDSFERQFIAEALEKYGSIRQTAKFLGVSHTTIMNKIKKYGL